MSHDNFPGQTAERTDCDEAGDYVVPDVLSPRDLIFRPDIGQKTLPLPQIVKMLIPLEPHAIFCVFFLQNFLKSPKCRGRI